ncbi:MAG TPA: hypothetical protein VMJ34_13820 [Bryobacteraceae bacterium]|nr:hypothetical protein [Bryobacteraceae bacterium]
MNVLEQLLLSPGLPYVVLAAGLITCIVLFLSVKLELRRRSGVARERNQVEETVDGLSAAFEQIRARLEDAVQPQAPVPVWSGSPSVNLSRKGQVLRLYRRGDTPRQIASALGMRQGEVDLILKVHQMVLNSAAGARAADSL